MRPVIPRERTTHASRNSNVENDDMDTPLSLLEFARFLALPREDERARKAVS